MINTTEIGKRRILKITELLTKLFEIENKLFKNLKHSETRTNKQSIPNS